MLTQDVVKAIQAELKETHEIEVSQATVKAFMASEKAVIVGALTRGEDVALKGFVSFESKEVAERTAKNPQNGEDVVVPAHRKASASLAKGLRKF